MVGSSPRNARAMEANEVHLSSKLKSEVDGMSLTEWRWAGIYTKKGSRSIATENPAKSHRGTTEGVPADGRGGKGW